MQRKAGFSRLSVIKEMEKRNPADADSQMKKSTSVPLLKFQNLVSTITMAQSFVRNRSHVRKLNSSMDSGEFHISHSTSPDDYDRRPDTTMTDPNMIRTDVLSRLNMSEHFRFTTKPNRKFQEVKVYNAIKDVLEEQLDGCAYSAEFCQKVSPLLADSIKERVKTMVFPRYKIISHVIMGQIAGQTMRCASRCAWNEQFDSFAQYCYQSSTLYAIGVVYGVYAE